MTPQPKDLMLGDWLAAKVQTDDTGKEPVYETLYKRVTGLDKGFIELEDYAHAGAEISAIGLTPQMLLKNGFVLRDGCTSAWDLHLPSGYSVYMSGTGGWIPMSICIYKPSSYGNGFARMLDECTVAWVHKLQHILHEYIPDEIDFKI